ncbi:MAG: hypothetical protein ABI685_11795 [Ferruginibacter sp.]
MQYCKCLIITCCAFLFSASSFSQSASATADMTGLWTGLMFNDTTELNYRYEIAISEKNGNLTGYSQTFFIIEGIEYYGLKKIKITIDGDKVITQDLKLLDNNYPSTVKIPKGVYVINVLNFEQKNDVLMLNGMFETNRTKKYAPATGYIHVEKKTDLSKSALVKHLDELGLVNELSFVPEAKATEIMAVAKTEAIKEQPVAKTIPVEKQKIVKEKSVKEKQPKVKTSTEIAVIKEEPQKTTTPKATGAAADIKNRIIETIQSVNYTSDSLVISLYDNGEVDGDTVSVLMNGEVIMPMVGLSTNAVRKTIYTKDITDSIQIVMYAENLGSLPPNTGLLIVYDGKQRYEIRFSGDLKKNSAIVFRRKEN